MQFAKWTELSFLLSEHISKANIAWRSVSTESVQYIFLSELNDACHSNCCLSEPIKKSYVKPKSVRLQHPFISNCLVLDKTADKDAGRINRVMF